MAVLRGPKDRRLRFDGNRVILRLLENLDDPLAAFDLCLGRRIEVGAGLGDCGQLVELRQL